MAYKLVLSDDALKQLKKMDRHVGMMLAKDLKKRLEVKILLTILTWL